MLSTVRDQPADMQTLFELQKLLIAEVTLAEGRVRQNKALARGERGKRSRHFEVRAQGYRRSIYFWKAIGDAIAFLYCDRFALKHVYYNTHNAKVRQDGGFISGSAGFKREFEVLGKLLDDGCPCVLCDLTNTVRYGDICVLAGDDPKILEVKTSGTRDRRMTRQIRNIRKLQDFYATDASHGLRGFPTVHRVETRSAMKSFESEFNQCIDESYERGYAVKSPESGVCYVAIAEDVRQEEIFEQVSLGEPWAFSLNEVKWNQAWSPYYPFTLLIRSERALYDFILGRLFIMAVLDVAVMKNLVSAMGYTPEFDAESDYPIRGSRNGGEEQFGVSVHLLKRAALETLSLRWVVEEGIRDFEDSVDRAG